MQKRDAELDTLLERIYEDNAAQKISDERFSKMSAKYEAEQDEFSERMKAIQAFFESEEGLREFEVWKQKQAEKLTPGTDRPCAMLLVLDTLYLCYSK